MGFTRFLIAYIFASIGDLGKELKNLITMMDQEEEAEAEAAATSSRRTPVKNSLVSKISTTNSNKESPV